MVEETVYPSRRCQLAALPQDQVNLGRIGYREGSLLAKQSSQTDVGYVRSLDWERKLPGNPRQQGNPAEVYF